MKITGFLSNKNGVVVPIFALCALAVCMIMVMAFDVRRAGNTKAKLQHINDFALLATANAELDTEAEMAQFFQEYVNNQLGGAFTVTTNFTLLPDGAIAGEINTLLDNVGGGLLGQDTTNVGVYAEVPMNQPGGSLDLAISLDNTGSMQGWPMDALKEAASGLVRAVMAGEGTRVSLTTFRDDNTYGIRLTENQDEILREIDAMYGYGWTHIPAGLDDARFKLNLGRSAGAEQRAMVLMTDGANTLRDTEAADDRMMNLCQEIKNDDIILYTVAFQLNDIRTVQLLSECASDTGKAFDVRSTSGLISTFEQIAADLGSGQGSYLRR